VMAAELGWDHARVEEEVGRYLDMIAADLAAEAEPDDLSAYLAKRGTPTPDAGRPVQSP